MSSNNSLVQSTVPQLAQPATIFDLMNFRLSEVYSVSGSLVTRLCEGEFGITREEWAFLAMIAVLGPLSPSDLAAQTMADRSQASRTLRGLEAKKLIHREPLPCDRRRIIMRLSEQGLVVYHQLFPRVVEIHHAVLSDLDAAELNVLARCIQKMQVRVLEVKKTGLVAAQANRRTGGRKMVGNATLPSIIKR